MALLIENQPSCSIAWLKAAKAVNERPRHEAHNVMIEILDPLRRSTDDRNIAKSVDDFLRKYHVFPLSTVANTIFPRSLSRRHTGDSFYAEYLRILPKISKGSWGTYFGRMIEHKTADNQIINPLQTHIIERLKKCVHGKNRTYRNIYELRIYDPDTNISIHNPGTETERRMGGPCLSFMSFKLDNKNRLLLTALYRNHYYIQRLLGNMIGLSQCMNYVATQADIEIGTLTVVSTHAQIDIGGNKGRWRHSEVVDLLNQCETYETMSRDSTS